MADDNSVTVTKRLTGATGARETMSILFHGECGTVEEGPPILRVMSTFSGIGAASISWLPIRHFPDEGVEVPVFDFVAYSEIEPFPCHVLHYRRNASRPRYMPDPLERGISDKERKVRAKRIADTAHLPETGIVNFGDITQITDDDLRQLGTVEVLEGGSPCQAFSFAGARQGLEDPRGNLLLAFCQLAERMRRINALQYVVWENVHGVLSEKTNAFGCLLASLAGEQEGPLQRPGKRWTNAGRVLGPEGRCVAWRTIQAAHWGIPQLRKRVFVVANLGTAISGTSAAYDVLFESEGSRWSTGSGLRARQAVVPTFRRGDRIEYRSAEERYRDPKVRARLQAEASHDWVGIGLDRTLGNVSLAPSKIYALADDYAPKASRKSAYALLAGSPSGGGRRQMVVYPQMEGVDAGTSAQSDPTSSAATIVVGPMKSGALYGREAKPIGVSSEHNFVVITKPEGDENPENWVVRHFTPLECERLQGFPDFWTDVPFKGSLDTDNRRYKAIGNSMPCPVMAWIGHCLFAAVDMQAFIEHMQASGELKSSRRGRPPKNGTVAMSPAERQRQRRERLRAARLKPA